MPSFQPPGSRWFSWLRNATLRIGILTGVYLSAVLWAWLVVANRIPWSANFALPRNAAAAAIVLRSEEHTSELQSRLHLVCRLLLEKKKKRKEIDKGAS